MKTPLQELITIIEDSKREVNIEGVGLCDVLDYHGVHDKMREFLKKEKSEILNAYFEGKMDSVRENRGHMIAELYFKERYA